MDLMEAIRSRKSIRAFKPNPVPKNTLVEIVEIATRAPSSVNIQPWEIYLVLGDTLKAYKNACVGQLRAGVNPHPEYYTGKTRALAPVLEGVFKERQVKLAMQMFEALGITKEDKEKRHKWYEKMYRFYDAPAIFVIAVDRMLGIGWVLFDLGLLTQSITLAALEYGLGTCIMRAIVDYPEAARAVLKIPERKTLVMGVAVGLPDFQDPINHLISERENLNKIITVLE